MRCRGGRLDGSRHPRTRLRGWADRPRRFHWEPALTVVAATVLAIGEPRVRLGARQYGEITPIILSGVLGLLMAFIAYGRMFLQPIS